MVKFKSIILNKKYILYFLFIPLFIIFLLITLFILIGSHITNEVADKREILEYNTITVKKRNEIINQYTVLTKTLNETEDLVKISKANNSFIAAVNEFNFYITTFPTDPKLQELRDLNTEYAQICFNISEIVDLILQRGSRGEDITPLLDDYNEKKAELNLLNDEIYEKGIDMLSFM